MISIIKYINSRILEEGYMAFLFLFPTPLAHHSESKSLALARLENRLSLVDVLVLKVHCVENAEYFKMS